MAFQVVIRSLSYSVLITCGVCLATTGRADEAALVKLKHYLQQPAANRPKVQLQEFASKKLSRVEASEAMELLAEDRRRNRDAKLNTIVNEKQVVDGELTMPFEFYEYGEKPDSGWPLYLSLHGGGNTPARVNDGQWNNQKRLYEPKVGIYCAPRAPTNTWNLWHEPHVDRMFSELIEAMVDVKDVDWNHVYVLGYSAGGDGVYQLAPRMADRWAAAAMMAGHPGDAAIENLRNLPFALQVGGRDSAYNRNKLAVQWQSKLQELSESDPGAYKHFAKIYQDKGHWMDREDSVAIPWMAEFRRDPIPKRVVWTQDDVLRESYYWLASKTPKAKDSISIRYDNQEFNLEAISCSALSINVDDRMMNLDLPISVRYGDTVLFTGMVNRTISNLATTLALTGDPNLSFSGRIDIVMPSN